MVAECSVADGRCAAEAHPTAADVACYTDKYFTRTRQIVERFGDIPVTYAVFMRRPVLYTARLALNWLKGVMTAKGAALTVEECFAEGDWVGAGEPMLYLTGSFVALAELETLFLQKIGAASVAAFAAYQMASELPKTAFLAMDARHCAGTEMAELMAYAASVGSKAAQDEIGATGFIGNSTDATAHFFGQPGGLGTMPHALIGYAGSTVRAAEMFHETFPEVPLYVLVDYFGHEITDTLAVCARFPELARQGKLGIRLDTHGGRFIEGLDTQKSYAMLDKHAPDALRGYRSEVELRHLIGTGVSAAAIWHVRQALDTHGFNAVKIIVSSGFSGKKCSVMAVAHAPIDVIGTGSFLPDLWSETYATADIVAYDGEPKVKVGREFLLRPQSSPQE